MTRKGSETLSSYVNTSYPTCSIPQCLMPYTGTGVSHNMELWVG